LAKLSSITFAKFKIFQARAQGGILGVETPSHEPKKYIKNFFFFFFPIFLLRKSPQQEISAHGPEIFV